MEGLVRRWRGHGWSRLSHGVHTGGGRARITVTLVSVGPRSVASPASLVLTFQRDIHCSFSSGFFQTNSGGCQVYRQGVRRSASGGLGAAALKGRGNPQVYRTISVYRFKD